jgi:hypothetical protein
MHTSAPLPVNGEVFLDARGSDRALRVSWHTDVDTVVLSLWRTGVCAGSFRLRADDVPGLVQVLRTGLGSSYQHHRGRLEQMLDGDLAG